MKIAIIGAGINGLYIGLKLAKASHSVTIFERKKNIGKEACSGLFSQNILKFIPESKDLIKNEINYCFINFPKRKIKVEFSNSKFFVIDHAELDKILANLAEKQGVKIILNVKKEDLELNNLEKNFDRIIGCDGALSQIREKLKLKNPNFYLGILGIREENINFQEKNFVETWATKNGFIWKIPRENKLDKIYIEYGIMEKPYLARKLFAKFLKNKNINFKIIKSAIIPNGFILPNNPKITICGDALGLTKPWSGGGVIWGLIAADILVKNFPDFLKYHKQLRRFFLLKIILSKIIKNIVYFLGFNFPFLMPKKAKIKDDFLI